MYFILRASQVWTRGSGYYIMVSKYEARGSSYLTFPYQASSSKQRVAHGGYSPVDSSQVKCFTWEGK